MLSSLIWICTTTNNNTKVVIIDANKPDIVLETFHISCQAHIGCIASVPGKYNLYSVQQETHCDLIKISTSMHLHMTSCHQNQFNYSGLSHGDA